MSKQNHPSKGKLFNIDEQARKFYPNPKASEPIIGIIPFHAVKLHSPWPERNSYRSPYSVVFQCAA